MVTVVRDALVNRQEISHVDEVMASFSRNSTAIGDMYEAIALTAAQTEAYRSNPSRVKTVIDEISHAAFESHGPDSTGELQAEVDKLYSKLLATILLDDAEPVTGVSTFALVALLFALEVGLLHLVAPGNEVAKWDEILDAVNDGGA